MSRAQLLLLLMSQEMGPPNEMSGWQLQSREGSVCMGFFVLLQTVNI